MSGREQQEAPPPNLAASIQGKVDQGETICLWWVPRRRWRCGPGEGTWLQSPCPGALIARAVWGVDRARSIEEWAALGARGLDCTGSVGSSCWRVGEAFLACLGPWGLMLDADSPLGCCWEWGPRREAHIATSLLSGSRGEPGPCCSSAEDLADRALATQVGTQPLGVGTGMQGPSPLGGSDSNPAPG